MGKVLPVEPHRPHQRGEEAFIDRSGRAKGPTVARARALRHQNESVFLYQLNSVDRVDKTAAALKFEFLAGGTEMAFFPVGKENRPPVAGYDFSAQAVQHQFLR